MKTLITTLIASIFVATSGIAGELVNVSGKSGAALNGYDTVAFFTEGKPVHGDPGITAEYQGATYYFSSKENRNKFEADPSAFAPQYGGYCAYGVSKGALFPVDISTWQIADGKLYLNLNPQVLQLFNADLKNHLEQADKKWPVLVQKNS